MSAKASRYASRKLILNRLAVDDFYEEEVDFLSQSKPPMFFGPCRSSEKNCWYLTDRAQRSILFAYAICANDSSYPLLENESTYYLEKLEQVIYERKKEWGDLILEGTDIKTLTHVIDVLDWFPSGDTGKLVQFVNSLPLTQLEDWEITADWDSFLSTGKLTYTVENPDQSYTTERDPRLKNYSFDVLQVAKAAVCDKTETFTPLIGVELEFIEPSYSLESLIPVLGLGIFKSDSTTDVEWVSVPLEYEELICQIENRKSAFSRMLQNNGAETNGMHVHVSRSNISLSQEARIYYLVNARKNRHWWAKIADRDVANNSYCSFVDLSAGLIEAVKSSDYSDLRDRDFSSYRSVTVNRTKGATLEFRLFKSPDNVEKVLDNLKTVQLLLEYTRKGGYRLPGFIDFLKDYGN